MKLAIVAPVYNEELGIQNFHKQLTEVLSKIKNTEIRIIYAVDKGEDNSLEILREIAAADAKVTVLGMSRRYGHQASLLAGIEEGQTSDATIMMDCDLQHPPILIPTLMEKFKEGFDIVYTIRQKTEGISVARKFAGNSFYCFLNMLSDIPIQANSADFRLISKRVATTLIHDFPERNLFLRGLFSWMGFPSTFVEYKALERNIGHSKYSFKRILKFATSGIISFSSKPLYMGIVLGSLVSAIAILYLFIILINFFFDSTLPSGWTSLIILILFFNGIQFIIIGIIGTYIGELYNEVKGRPRYIIEERIISEGNKNEKTR